MKTVEVSIQTLVSDPNNARLHNEKNLNAIKGSIKKFGVVEPLVVRRANNQVIGGNGRLSVLKELGYKQVPVNYVDVDEKTAIAMGAALNRTAELAEWDKDVLGSQLQSLFEDDWDVEEFGFEFQAPTEPGGGLTDEDDVPEVQDNELGVKRGDIYKLGEHRLMCGDSTDKADVDRLMNGEKADMVFTDPPYGLNWSGGTWAKNENYQRAKEWDTLLTQEQIKFIISLAENAVVWGGNYYSLPASKCWLSWKKPSIPTMADFELAWTNFNKPAKQFESNRTPDGKKCHAAQKPISLFEWAFDYFKPNSVLDLFLGSGSTLIACEKTQRKCYGMEIDPHYCSVIIKRWQDFTGKTAEKITEPHT